MKASDFIIVIMSLSIFASGFIIFIAGTDDYYNVTVDAQDQEFMKIFNESIPTDVRDDIARKGQKLIEESEEGETATEDVITFKGITALLKLPFKTLETMVTLTTAASKRLGVPAYIFGSILTIFTVVVVFTIASAFMRRDI